MTLQSRRGLPVWSWVITLVLLLIPFLHAHDRVSDQTGQLQLSVKMIDSVTCWCSPLWGYHAAKIVEGKDGNAWIALFSGEYPEANVRIFKKKPEGTWQEGVKFTGAYQPSMLFVDGSGRLNVIQNSQTKPIVHLRATDNEGLQNFALVATGNGLGDGRGWYVGAGIHHDIVYMGYITLDYHLYLTWKKVEDTSWAPAIKVHQGSVDPTAGNHSWTRPHFQFDDQHGYMVVNETSDGSVKNSYNAVQLITFDLVNPSRVHTEEIDRVPMGFGAFSPDFLLTPDGWMHCVVQRGNRYYESSTDLHSDPGVFVFSRRCSGGQWTSRRVFDTVTECALVLRKDGTLNALRVLPGENAGSCQAMGSSDHGVTWGPVSVTIDLGTLTRPSHIQFASSANNEAATNGTVGVFEDERGKVTEKKISRYGFYVLQVNDR